MSLSDIVWKKEKTWPVWAGDTSDLRKLLEAIETVAEANRDAFVAHKTRAAREDMEWHEENLERLNLKYPASDSEKTDHPGWIKNQMLSHEASLRESQAEMNRLESAARRAPLISVTVSTPENVTRSAKGRASDLLELVDDRSCEAIRLSVSDFLSSGPLELSLSLSQRLGAVLEISSASEQIGISAWDRVSGELDKTLPWWSFLRRAWVTNTFSAISAMLMLVFLMWDLSSESSLLPAIGTVAGLQLILVFTLISTKRFDLARTGQKPATRVRLGILGGGVLALSGPFIQLLFGG